MVFLSFGYVKWKLRNCRIQLLQVKLKSVILFLLVTFILYYAVKKSDDETLEQEEGRKYYQFTAPTWSNKDLLLDLVDTCYVPKVDSYVFKEEKSGNGYSVSLEEPDDYSRIKSSIFYKRRNDRPVLRIEIKRSHIKCTVQGFRIGASNKGLLQVHPTSKILETTETQEVTIRKKYSSLRVKCRLTPNDLLVYENYHSVLHINKGASFALRHWKNASNLNMPVDIILIAVDSLSRGVLRQKLPKLHNYLQSSPLIEMKGFTSYGSTARASMFPFVAAGESMFPRKMTNLSRPTIDPEKFASVATMKVLQDLGYVTFYGEDISQLITPTRTPILFEYDVDTTYNVNDITVATKLSRERGRYHKNPAVHLLNHTLDLLDYFDHRAPVGALIWIKAAQTRLRESTLALLDNYFITFLRSVFKRRKRRAVVMLFGNRGYWGQKVSTEYEELVDQRMPALYISASKLKTSMLYNSGRLLSPPDVWRTVQAVASQGLQLSTMMTLRRVNENVRVVPYDLINQVVPPQRGCVEAGVRPSLCPCSKSSSFSPNSSHLTATFVAIRAVEKMNYDLQRSNNLACVALTFEKVLRVVTYNLSDDLQVFRLLFSLVEVPHAIFSAIVIYNPGRKLVQFPCRYDWVEQVPSPKPSQYKCLTSHKISIGCHYATNEAKMGLGMLDYLKSICHCTA